MISCARTGQRDAADRGQTGKGIALLARSRSSLLPSLATAHEQGLVDFEAITWNALFLPKGTPAPIIKKLNDASGRKR